jgi:hypothetical protein
MLVLLVLLQEPAFLYAQHSGSFDSDAEAQIFSDLNASREQAGVPPFRLDPKLTEAARRHTVLLQQHREISHQYANEPPLTDRLRAAGAFFNEAAENAGLNSDLDNVNEMFLSSPGHRANMLNPDYTHVGIGVVHSGGTFWITEDFAREPPSISAAEAADEAARSFDARWKQAHLAPLKRVTISPLHTLACDAAGGGKLQGKTVTLNGEEARQLLAFSTPDPSTLSSSADAVLQMGQLRSYAVAVCTPQEGAGNGQFWVLMAFF